MKEKKVLCYGEILLRGSPTANGMWLLENKLPIYLGGAECNVAHALAKWEMPVSYVSAMPDNFVSEGIISYLKGKGIDGSKIILSGDRIGLFFLQQGTDMKNRGVVYDRAGSSFASLRPGEIDWDAVLDDADWFHFSAISPALNQNATDVCREGLEAASKKGITISVDLNYRAKLWQYGKKPVDIMPELTSYANVIMGNIWAANTLLGIPLDEALIDKNKEAYVEHAQQSAERIFAAYKNCSTVANTFRFTDPNAEIRYYATFHQPGSTFFTPSFHTSNVADTVGSGDCFMAGLIYGLRLGNGPQKIVNYAASAAFGKLHELGDTTNQTVSEVETIAAKYVI